MALYPEVKTPLRMYDSRTKRNNAKIVCQEGKRYKLHSLRDQLLPFQIYLPAAAPISYLWVIKDESGDVIFTCDSDLLDTYYFDNWNYIIYTGQVMAGLLLGCGYYTTEIHEVGGTNTWYSEEFYVSPYRWFDNIVKNHNFKDGFDEWVRVGLLANPGPPTSICNPSGVAGKVSQLGLLEKNTLYEVTVDMVDSDDGAVVVGLGGEGATTTMEFFSSGKQCGYSDDTTDLVVVLSGYTGCVYSVSVRPVYLPMYLEWSNCSSIGKMYYGISGFVNRFYFDIYAEVIQNEPKITQEGNEDNNKQFVQLWAKRTTVYNIYAGLLPGYVIDALFEMLLHDTITLHLPNNNSGQITNVRVSPTWSDLGGLCLAETIITFEDDVTVVNGCCQEDELAIHCSQEIVIDVSGHGSATWYSLGWNEDTDNYKFVPGTLLTNAAAIETELNSLGLQGVTFTVVYDSGAGTVTITANQVVPIAYVFSYIGYDDSGYTFLPFGDGDCTINRENCTSTVTIDIADYVEGDTWSYLGTGQNVDAGSVADAPIPGSIPFDDLSTLQTYLNSLNNGTWTVTNPSGTLVVITNVQPIPNFYTIGDICIDVTTPEPDTICFQFESDCP